MTTAPSNPQLGRASPRPAPPTQRVLREVPLETLTMDANINAVNTEALLDDVLPTYWAKGQAGGGSDTSTDAPGITPAPVWAPHALGKVFRRALFEGELAQIQILLSSPAELRSSAAQEFRWALQSGGRAHGGAEAIDTAAALTALRQLSYLHGLPALDPDAARQAFGSSAVELDAFCDALPRLLRQAMQDAK